MTLNCYGKGSVSCVYNLGGIVQYLCISLAALCISLASALHCVEKTCLKITSFPFYPFYYFYNFYFILFFYFFQFLLFFILFFNFYFLVILYYCMHLFVYFFFTFFLLFFAFFFCNSLAIPRTRLPPHSLSAPGVRE